MKKLLIKLTGLMVTAAIVLSCSGIALATETGDTEDSTGVKQEESAEAADPEQPAPAKEEEPAPAEQPAAEEPAAEEPAAEEPAAEDPAKVEEPSAAAKDGEPAGEPQNGDSEEKEYSASGTVKYEFDKTNDELAEEYINRAFGKPSLRKRSADYTSQLSDQGLAIYNFWRTEITKIASGEASSTRLTIPEITYTKEDLGLTGSVTGDDIWAAACTRLDKDFNDAFKALLQSCPYELYWFDKTRGYGHNGGSGSVSDSSATLREFCSYFYVAKEYQENSNEFAVNSAYGTSVTAARERVMEIISQEASLDDYNKLKAYRDAICGLTDYNYDAAANSSTPYGNPWQLIWVFDDDPNTKVVCEGYSKAFQFLCDNSTFQSNDIRTYCVSGTTYFPDKYGPHMWNVVHMDDGKNYLVDVTNCDGDGMDRDSLFLRGKATGSSHGNGYVITFLNSSDEFDYAYDTEGPYQTPDIATSDYVYVPAPEPVTEPELLTSHSMILAGRIGLKFLADFPANYDGSDCYVMFTSSNGRTVRVDYSDSLPLDGSATRRIFTFYMNPLELADTVTATLHYDNDKTKVNSCSVITYIHDIEYHPDTRKFYLLNLLYKLQAYGYYLQQTGWTDGRNHTEIPVPVSTLNEYDVPKTIIDGDSLGNTISAVSGYDMTLTSANSVIADVRISLTLTSQTDLKIAVKPAAGVTITSAASEYSVVSINNEDYYVFTVANIGPKSLGVTKTVTINTDHGDATIDVAVMYYVKQVLGSSSFTADEKNAMIAYYNYYNAAMIYREE